MVPEQWRQAIEHPALVAAATHGLPGIERDPVVLDGGAETWWPAAQMDRLAGMVAAAVDDGVLLADATFAEVLRVEWHASLTACVAVEAEIVRVAATLDDAGVEWRLTKGAALAHLDYPDPSLRLFGDVDIVIHPRCWRSAVTALEAAGCARQDGRFDDDYIERFGKGATFDAPGGAEIDLHRRLGIGRFCIRSHTEDLFDEPTGIELAGRTIPCLSNEGRLLHACHHATIGGFRILRAFRDVAQLILVTGADVERTMSIAARWGAAPVVAEAILETWRRLAIPNDDIARWASTIRRSTVDQWAMRRFTDERTFRAQALTAVTALPWYAVPGYLWTLSGPARLQWKR